MMIRGTPRRERLEFGRGYTTPSLWLLSYGTSWGIIGIVGDVKRVVAGAAIQVEHLFIGGRKACQKNDPTKSAICR
jgi:hypothetical protein